MRLHSLFVFIILLTSSLHGQEFQVLNPLPIDPTLSGNYGELRPNHFHGGLDLKTGGKSGMDVLAAGSGYVSRIKVSPYGYGKALYIDHPEGYTTVYGHLNGFTDSIANYVRRVQEEQQSFEVDVYPGALDLQVRSGQVVAISGNTGGSGGPHLHFEVRETKTEVPRNPLIFGFPLKDSKRPVVEAIALYPLTYDSRINNTYKPFRTRITNARIGRAMAAQPIKVNGAFGIGVRGYDQQDGSSNHNGIYRLKLYVDSLLVSTFTADSVSFALSRHLNALIDYNYYYYNKARYIRMFRLPGNQLENIAYKEAGVLDLEHGNHVIEIVAEDFTGNRTRASLNVSVNASSTNESEKTEILPWNVPYFYEDASTKLYFPPGTVYDDAPFDFEPMNDASIIRILKMSEPVQHKFEIQLKLENPALENPLIAQVTSSGKRVRALQSCINDGWIRAESRSFGYFKIDNDTQKPRITSLNFRSNMSWSTGSMRFKIRDDFSGLKSYRATVNEKWVLLQYEPKQDLMFIDVNDLPKSDQLQTLRLEIIDMAGNVATFEGTFKHQ